MPFIYASIAFTILFFGLFDYELIGILEVIQIIICIVLFLEFNIYVLWHRY